MVVVEGWCFSVWCWFEKEPRNGEVIRPRGQSSCKAKLPALFLWPLLGLPGLLEHFRKNFESARQWQLNSLNSVKWKSLIFAQLFATPWTTQSMGFSRPEYWRGWPFPSPGDLPSPGIKPRSPALQVDSLPAEPQEKPTELSSSTFLEFCLVYGSKTQST